MSVQPLISIVIPSFNYGHYLLECFSNLQEQTYANWECLLVDNGSTDNTKQVVEEFSKKDTRVKYLFQPVKGPSAARNLGIKEAKGEYVQFLDADDLLLENKFKNALVVFEKDKEADIVYSDARYFVDGDTKDLFFSMRADKNNDRKWMCYEEGRKENMLPELLKENIMVISSPIIKKNTLDAIGYFDETLAFNEDWELWLRFAFADKKFVVDMANDSLALIRVHKTSHSRNPFKMFLAGLVIGLRYTESIHDKFLKEKFKKKTLYAIHSLEKLLHSNLNDTVFFNESISQLQKVYPQSKYLNWQNLYAKKQISRVQSLIKLSLLISSIKLKF